MSIASSKACCAWKSRSLASRAGLTGQAFRSVHMRAGVNEPLSLVRTPVVSHTCASMGVRFPTDERAAAAAAEDLDRSRVSSAGPADGSTSGERRIFVETYGCQMNERDSIALVSLMASQGYRATGNPEEADLIAVNTCSVREKAENKTYSELGKYRALKEQNPNLRLAVIGCVAQQIGERAVERMPYIDLVVGTHNLYAVPEMLREREESGSAIVRADFHSEDHKIFRPAEVAAGGRLSAFVNISVGCDHKCTYCIVPFTRGAEISRPAADILSEVHQLAEQGVKEITLLGQNVNSYGKQWAGEGPDFGELVFEVARVEGIERIRFTSPHPVNMVDSLYRAFAECEALMPHIHLPMQSGSDRVLRRMKREYGIGHYRGVVERLRAVRPGIAITTDVIVGFPGETDEDFRETLEMMEWARFDGAYTFAYSPRPGTPALRLPEKSDPPVARERLQALQSLQRQLSEEATQRYVGTVRPVLVEGRSRKRAEEICGRTPENWVVNFPGTVDRVGQVVPVRITRASPNSLRGELTETR